VKSLLPGDPTQDINNEKELLSYLYKVYKDAEDFVGEKTESYSADYIVFQQVKFFSCVNNFIDPVYQADISKYIYSQNTSTQPYNGSYGEQPALWIEKYFTIKKCIAEMEKVSLNKHRKKAK